MTMNLQYLGAVRLYYSSPWSNSGKKDRCGIRKIGSNFVEYDKICIIKLLYLSQINLERASNILGGNIPVGYTVSENLGDTVNQYVFARIHDR